jgi:integrase
MTFLATKSDEDVCSKQKVENYKSCQIWLEGYNSPYTKKAYKIHLSLFCKYYNTDPDSLLQLKPEHIKPMVLSYIIHLKKVAKQTSEKQRFGELSVNSIRTYLAGIQSFLESNDIVLNWKKIAKYYPEAVTNSLRAYTKEEISKLLSIADLRDRCLILLMVSTGMRVGPSNH